MWRHHHYLFCWPLQRQKQDIALKFCMRVVCMYLDQIYAGFLDNLKISNFIGNYIWKIKILNFGGQNRKMSKIQDSQLVARSILRFFLRLRIVFYSKRAHSRSLQTFAAFFTQNRGKWRH